MTRYVSKAVERQRLNFVEAYNLVQRLVALQNSAERAHDAPDYYRISPILAKARSRLTRREFDLHGPQFKVQGPIEGRYRVAKVTGKGEGIVSIWPTRQEANDAANLYRSQYDHQYDGETQLTAANGGWNWWTVCRRPGRQFVAEFESQPAAAEFICELPELVSFDLYIMRGRRIE